tara:strand:+ start:4561 stop:5397 length:837 start_codon:yes stop_codon:yes gene_type:complete
MSEIFREKLHKGLVQEIKIRKSLVDKESKYQKIQIFDSYTYGRILALDGIIQITEKDESAYSEMLVHPAMNCLIGPKNILIIGGGDGAVAEELLKYKFIERIDLVDIDIEVINLSKKYFKKVNNDSLNNKKVHIFDQDAYIFTSNSSMKYDLIIADRPDPVGAGKSLFKLKFYKNIKNLLKADGIAIFQSGVTFLQKKEIKEVIIKIKSVFENSGIILTVVPSYIGGHMTLVWASKKTRIDKLKKKKSLTRIKTDYFNLQISEASLSLPNFIKTIKKF